ncbi:MAG: VWA domain-containing protein [Acidobacteriota bacterium]
MRQLNFSAVFISLVIFLIVSPQSSGQWAKSTGDKNLQHNVTVVLKLIQVYVVDKKGDPVTDLTRGDFELYDDGLRKPLAAFEKHAVTSLEKIQKTNPDAEVEMSPPPPDMNRKFILLFDLTRTNISGIGMSKRTARRFIESNMQPHDEVTVMSYSTISGLSLHTYRSADRDIVLQAIERVKGLPERKEDPLFDKMLTLSFLENVREYAKSLRLIPGNKNLLLFSAGIPNSQVSNVLDFEDVRFQLDEMMEEMNSSGVSVYSINALGTRALLDDSVHPGDMSLKQFSRQTGGKYFNDVSYTDKITEDIQKITSFFYVLGFNIPDEWDGKFHTLRVAVKRKGCKVYTQSGYAGLKPFHRMTKTEKWLHLMELSSGGMSLSLDPEPLALESFSLGEGDKQTRAVMIPLEPALRERLGSGDLEVFVFLSGAGREPVHKSLGLLKREDLPEGCLLVVSRFTMEGDDETICRLIIRDGQSGHAATGSLLLTSPEMESRAAQYPHLFVRGMPPDAFCLTAEDEKFDDEFDLLDLSPLYPKDWRPVFKNVPEGTDLVRVLVFGPAVWDVESEGPFLLSMKRLNGEAATDTPMRIIDSMEREGRRHLLLEADLSPILPGEYELTVVSASPDSEILILARRIIGVR